MTKNQKLELTWIGKEIRPKLEPRILLEDPEKSCHAPHRVTDNDIWGKLAESRARRRAIELACIMDGQTVLEVAVGTGLAFFEIVKRNPNGCNVGIDLSTGMLSKARKLLGKLSGAHYELSIGTAFDLKTENESVDLLMNNYMFVRN